MRRVDVAGATPHADLAWVARAARDAALFLSQQEVAQAVLPLDNDQKLGPEFEAVLEAGRVPSVFLRHCHGVGPHQSLGNAPPRGPPARVKPPPDADDVIAKRGWAGC